MRRPVALSAFAWGVIAASRAAQFDSSPRVFHRTPLPRFGASAATRRAAYLGPNRPTNLVRATLLAHAYFDRHLGGCGGLEAVREEDDRWTFPTKVGFSGATGPEIRVDKGTGVTVADGLPTVADPSAVYGPPKIDPKAEARRYREYEGRTKGFDSVLRAAARIGPRQEIGEYEAWLMAKAYFVTQFGACGGIGMPRSGSQRWTTHTIWGAAGRPGPDILIDPHTGETWAKGHPHVADPRAYAKLVRRPQKP